MSKDYISKNIIFCNISWMEKYQGREDNVSSGGKWVNAHGYGHEEINFLDDNGIVRGFVESSNKKINISRIDNDASFDYLDDVLVVWCATKPNFGRTIVGYYNHARVYSSIQKRINEKYDGFYFETKSENAHLLSVDDRTFTFDKNKKGNFGQSNVWYGDAPESIEQVRKIKDYIFEIFSENDISYNTIYDEINLYKKEHYERENSLFSRVKRLRDSFVNDFPIDRIMDITLDDFIIAPMDLANTKSFCYRLYREQETSSLGNVYLNTCEIWKDSNNKINISNRYKTMFNNNLEAAFLYLKREISELLLGFKNKDYKKVENCKLNRTFRYRLLVVYFLEELIPVTTKATLYGYCDAIGLPYTKSEELLYINLRLLEYKNSILETKEWNTFVYMLFVDKLWRRNIKLELLNNDNIINQIEDCRDIEGKTKASLVKVRVNQSIFRNRLLSKYHTCVLCGISNEKLLIASHIKPWVNSNSKEKLDINNGLLLCANHDALFDGGLISFEDTGKLLISSKLNSNDISKLNLDCKSVVINDFMKGYLKFHRNNIFKR